MTEEFGKEGPIRSIFLSEFHHIAGPKIVYQYPEDYVTKKVFDAVSVYIIPKPQILKRIITVNVLGVKITGYPNEIKNLKYARNALIFNLCFVCDSTARTVHYEPAVKKLSEYLENLELENGFLSNEDSKHQIPGILKHILTDLNATGKCTVTITLSEQKPSGNDCMEQKAGDKCERRPSLLCERKHLPEGKITYDGHERRLSMFTDQRQVDSAYKVIRKLSLSESRMRRRSFDMSPTSVLHLKVVGVWPDPAHVLDHHVPVLIPERVYSRGDHWDLTTQQILPYIDGFTHIAKIAAAADVENNLVKACVENLLYYGQVRLLPIFQYSNVYTLTSGIQKLYDDQALQEECQHTICKHFASRPQLSHILTLYSSMTYGVTVRDLCIRFNPQALNIDERKLVQFGLQNGIIRRLNRYPIVTPTEDTNTSPAKHSAVHIMCNGTHSFDEICCKFGLTNKELQDKVERDPNIIVLWKQCFINIDTQFQT